MHVADLNHLTVASIFAAMENSAKNITTLAAERSSSILPSLDVAMIENMISGLNFQRKIFYDDVIYMIHNAFPDKCVGGVKELKIHKK